jgi:multidrug efflux pump subunit AcrB
MSLQVYYPGNGPGQIEQIVMRPIRETMLSLSDIRGIESTAHYESGRIVMGFAQGTDMSLAYVEASEKLDRLTPVLPRDLRRPVLTKASASDIPIVRLQVIPRTGNMLDASQLAERVIRRRIEQLAGVGQVNLGGIVEQQIVVQPRNEMLLDLGIETQDVLKSIEQANARLGSVSIRDGNYRYNVKLDAGGLGAEQIRGIPITSSNGEVVPLARIADITTEPAQPPGIHLYGESEAAVIAIHMQETARMPDLMKQIEALTLQFREEYGNYSFELTQDQSALLTFSVQNLEQALVGGGLLVFAVLFAFLRGWREPLLMGVILPLSLVLSLGVLDMLGLGLNIITLSGLVLGLGMLVDNSIVVVDSISSKRRQGMSSIESCVLGVREVTAPLIGSAFTNLAVFTPMMFAGGVPGALFYDQAAAVASILSVSLICTLCVIPLLYLRVFKDKGSLSNDTRLLGVIREIYVRSFAWTWKHKLPVLVLAFLLIPGGLLLFFSLPKQAFPVIERFETVLRVDWNEAIDLGENKDRVRSLVKELRGRFTISESDIGLIANSAQSEGSRSEAVVYFRFADSGERLTGDSLLEAYLSNQYPMASYAIVPAPNAFEQLFSRNKSWVEARFRDYRSRMPMSASEADTLLARLTRKGAVIPLEGFSRAPSVELQIKREKLAQYDIQYSELVHSLSVTFGGIHGASVEDYGDEIRVHVGGHEIPNLKAGLETTYVRNAHGHVFPAASFLIVRFREDLKAVRADEAGVYQSVGIGLSEEPENFIRRMNDGGQSLGLQVEFQGEWFANKTMVSQVVSILLVSVLLVYLILSAEFESLRQPLLVMITLPMGLAGSLLLLWMCDEGINVMSGIGLAIVLGVLDNDAILKIDRINMLVREMPVERAVHQAGLDRLRPIVMNTMTNMLAVTPVIFFHGMGADLQRPVAIATLGGLLVSTLTALYVVPILYYYLRGNGK